MLTDYEKSCAEQLEKLRDKEDLLIIALESSCDETACAVTRGRKVLSSVIASQIDIHKRYGGVVPEIASRNHVMAISQITSQAIADAGIKPEELDCVAVTYGAGLLGALLVGVSFAKAYAYALGKPLIPVNHIRGHVAANYIAKPDLKPPYICLIASGGHTAVVRVDDFEEITLLGSTQDDACGEAFDKVARVLGLEYPGGPQIQKLAREGKPVVQLPTPLKNSEGYDFSYSGLKTAVINYVHSKEQKGEEFSKADIACSFQEKAVSIMTDAAVRAAKDSRLDTIVIAGGVAANERLREVMIQKAEKHGLKVYYPPLSLCTDNAAMIASEAYNLVRSGADAAKITIDASATVKITDVSPR